MSGLLSFPCFIMGLTLMAMIWSIHAFTLISIVSYVDLGLLATLVFQSV